MRRPFLLGVNYWPRDRAMAMWRGGIDRRRVFEDLAEIRDLGLDVVRLFLFWQDFQPTEGTISERALADLVAVTEEAGRLSLQLMPTFFVGHMSGVNFLPSWARRPGAALVGPFAHLFRRLPEGDEIGDVYAEPALLAAQLEQAVAVVKALKSHHRAIYAYDLGNEPSLVYAPKTPERALSWSETLAGALRGEDPSAKVTVGTFQGDLEHDTGFWPSALKRSTDLLSVHGYPSYAPWTGKTLDPDCLPFLVHLTRALAGGGEALAGEFGAPYAPHGFTEDEIGAFLAATLPKIRAAGALGAFVWNFSDYEPPLAPTPPFDKAPHEMAFGILRADGTRKPAALALKEFAARRPEVVSREPALEVSEAEFYRDPYRNLTALYQRYKEAV
jgi:endo-1,4-beta-mannosidase